MALKMKFIQIIHIFFMLLMLCLSWSCAPKEKSGIIYKTEKSLPEIRYFKEYYVSCGDILDIIYQIRPLVQETYKLKIQDVVEVRFPSMGKHNYQQVIRPDGRITLPYINDLYLLNLTTSEATAKIQAGYKDVLRFPDAFLLLKEFGAGTKELKKVITTASRGQSKLITVRPDGVITYPLIGDQYVAGMTIPAVSACVNNAYKELYPELQVDVILYKTAGSNIYITGEVKKPGVYPINRPVTAGMAMAMAGGATSDARLSNIVISRRQAKKMSCRIINFKSEKEFILLQPDDILFIPKRRLATAAQIAKEISEITFFRGYSVGFSWELYSDDGDY